MKNEYKSGQIFNVFNVDEINKIGKILSFLPNLEFTKHYKLEKDNSSHDHFIETNFKKEIKSYTNGFTEKDPIYKILEKQVFNKIKSILDIDTHIACGMYLKELIPWGIHTDYIHKFDFGRTPDFAFLIPLEIIGTGSMTNTVIFNEICTDSLINFIKNNKKLETNAKMWYNDHLSHVNQDILEYVSLKSVCAWEPGTVIYWDRKLLHSSDNFLKNSVVEKRALVLFTTKEGNYE
jgi:hypothetical protein